MQILLVDDDPTSSTLTDDLLKHEGYLVRRAAGARAAMDMLKHDPPQLVLLDVSLPDANGFDLCRQIRRSSNIPIIFLSARTSLSDRVTGLQVGADDYLCRPYEPEELLARVEAVLRRYRVERFDPSNPLSVGGYLLDPLGQRVTRPDGKSLELTPIEARLLYYLMQHAGRTLSVEQIVQRVWGYDDAGDGNLVAVTVRRLRSKVEPLPERPSKILTVRNAGYRFEP